jgi:site-specific DNA-methyltransferase (cytosine-N4-specific)
MRNPMKRATAEPVRPFHKSTHGRIFLGDSLALFRDVVKEGSVDLVMTSPPFGLVRKKDYGNVDAHEYLEWFKPFGEAFRRSLKPQGSLVIDIGGAWIPGQPTRSLYHYELLVMLCREFGFHLAQEFFWWNPARLPTPAEWVTVRRIRVKDAINCIWWLSTTPWPKASNRRILQPYSESMRILLEKGYTPRLRPSGHDISDCFGTDNGAAIPPNLIALAHTESNSAYIRYCTKIGLKPHSARFPVELPEFFIRMLTDDGDLVVDPFAGSCVTGEAAERLHRKWICCEIVEDFVKGALGRFLPRAPLRYAPARQKARDQDQFYRAYKPGLISNGSDDEPLSSDGGAKRPASKAKPNRALAHAATVPAASQLTLLETPPSEKGRRRR